MTFVPVNFDDTTEPKAAAQGNYRLRITDAKEGTTGPNSKNPGSPQLIVNLEFVDEINVPGISHFISFPHPSDDPKKANFKALMLKRFLVLFGVPFDANGVDTDRACMEMIGCEANCDVTLGDPDDSGNVYNRLKLPKLAAS